jgi:hypothetical protein
VPSRCRIGLGSSLHAPELDRSVEVHAKSGEPILVSWASGRVSDGCY